MTYNPPCTITPRILKLVAEISEAIGRLSAQVEMSNALRLRRSNRIRTIQGSLAIEGNTLTEEQITAILEGRRVIAPPREVLEVQNALKAYDQLTYWQPGIEQDLLKAHAVLMQGLLDGAGQYHQGGVGVMSGSHCSLICQLRALFISISRIITKLYKPARIKLMLHLLLNLC